MTTETIRLERVMPLPARFLPRFELFQGFAGRKISACRSSGAGLASRSLRRRPPILNSASV
jgi:hypothetical protein